jgi:hypothetical protein
LGGGAGRVLGRGMGGSKRPEFRDIILSLELIKLDFTRHRRWTFR